MSNTIACKWIGTSAGLLLLGLAGSFSAEGQESAILLRAAAEASAIEAQAARKDDNRTAILVRGNNGFALDLYGKLAANAGPTANILYSPHSVAGILGLAYCGAKGETAEQMAKTLHLNLGPQHLPSAYASLQQALARKPAAGILEKDRSNYQLLAVHALWGQKGLGFRPEYVKQAQTGFAAEVREVDFQADANKVRESINQWASEQTQGKFPELLRPGSVTSGTEVLLTSAIYLQAAWARPFNRKSTEDAPFFVTPDKQVKVPLMRQMGIFPYCRTKTLQVLELPYQGGDLSMVVFLPDRKTSLGAFEKMLDPPNVAEWLGQLKKQEIQVYLPRFRIAFDHDLRESLTTLGMPLAFSPEGDFSGMTGKKNFHLSAVLYRAYIAVNEEGTEAMAATAGIGKSGIDDPVIFRADRPFLFLLRDTRTNAILFLGRLVNPL